MNTIEYKGYTVMTEYLHYDMSNLIFVKELNIKFSMTNNVMLLRGVPIKDYVENCVDYFLYQKREMIRDSFNKSFSRRED